MTPALTRFALFILALLVVGGAPLPARAEGPVGVQLSTMAGKLRWTAPPSPEWAALLDRLYAENIKDQKRMNGADLSISMALVDLDGDGYPELLTIQQGFTTCGSRGCTIAVLKRTDKGWTGPSLLNVIGDELEIGPPAPAGQWRTIRINGYAPWAFNGKQYVIQR